MSFLFTLQFHIQLTVLIFHRSDSHKNVIIYSPFFGHKRKYFEISYNICFDVQMINKYGHKYFLLCYIYFYRNIYLFKLLKTFDSFIYNILGDLIFCMWTVMAWNTLCSLHLSSNWLIQRNLRMKCDLQMRSYGDKPSSLYTWLH